MAITGAALLLPPGAAQAAATASPDAATSTLVSVTIDGVRALRLRAFHGTFATSAVAQNDGDDAADTAQDPAGVLRYVAVNGAAQSKTHSDPAKTWARSQLAPAYSLHGKQIYTIGSLDSYADCTSAYVHEDGVKVLGTAVPAGKTTAVPVTGSQIGVRGVDHGTLDVTYTTTAASGHAHLDLDITGSFYNSAGRELYSGPVQNARFGDVRVTCADSPSASSSPSTAPTPPTAATSPAVTVTVTSNGPAAANLPEPTSPADSLESAAKGGSAPRHRSAHTSHPYDASSSGPPAAGNGSMQPAAKATAPPAGKDVSVWWMALSGLGLGGGALLYFVTRRRGEHQQ